MTTSASSQTPFDFFGLDWMAPHPRQDTDLLKQFSFIPGLKELLMVRQVHALEHATVWLLSEPALDSTPERAVNQMLGGMSTERGFYIYGNVNTASLQWAARTALQRITNGEWHLAVHPRCGTNLSVGMLLTAGVAFGVHLVLPKGPLEQLIAIGVATSTAAHLAPDLGSLAQKYFTTAIPFNLEIADISFTHDFWGRPAHFVRLRWSE